jgi:anaerobic selenocysteine-containing dehydrogenase
VTQGFLCHRTNQFLHTQYSPERLTTPLLRKGDDFVPIGWDEALDLAAKTLLHIRKESGPASIFYYRSGGSLGMLKMLGDYFFEQFGPVTIKRGDICSGAGDAAQMLDFGDEDSHDLFDLLNSKSILLWGKNVFTSSPHTIPVLKQARAHGAEIVLIDPLHTKTVSLAQRYFQVRPGGDLSLAMAVARVLFERNWTDPDAKNYCDHLDEFRALAFSRSLEAWCAEADLPVSVAVELAERLGVRKPAAILVGWGMGRRVNGSSIVRSLDALCAISGNIGVPGGGVSYYFKRRGAFDTSFIKGIPVAPRTICEPLMGREVLAQKDPPIRAMWITCGNPVAMLPDSRTTAEALRSREFTVVVDSFLTDTARCAHLVLPTTTLLEADDLVGAYGHHFIGSTTPVLEPPEGVKDELEILQALAERAGMAQVMRGDVRSWKERFLHPGLASHGVNLEALEKDVVRNPLPPKVLFADRKFPTASGKVNLMTALPVVDVEPPDQHFPLTLMSMSTERSQSSQWAKPPEGPSVLTVHPDMATGLADGDVCQLESRLGSMQVKLKFDPKQRRDVAIIPKGGHLRTGHCANALIRARTTDLGEGGAYYDERVRITPSPKIPR